MQSSCRSLISRHIYGSSNICHFKRSSPPLSSLDFVSSRLLSDLASTSQAPPRNRDVQRGAWMPVSDSNVGSSMMSMFRGAAAVIPFSSRSMTTVANASELASQEASISETPRIKFKRMDKTARHIMQILDKEAVEEVRSQREIPDIKPGYIIQLKVVVPENKRRVSTLKGTVIARRNAGLNSTFRLRRMVAGVGIESLFPLYSPNIMEVKILEKKKVRRAKLYYLRNRMNALRK